MKLVQLNAWSGKLIQPLCQFLQAEQPDILHAQEILSSPAGMLNQFAVLQKINDAAGLSENFLAPTKDFVYGDMRIEYGNAILSKMPLLHRHQEFTHGHYIANYDPAKDDFNARLSQSAAVEIGSKTLNLINYHGFYVQGNKHGNEETSRHCQRIAEFMENLTGPKILTGDFNLAPDSESLEPLNRQCRNLVIENKIDTTRNRLASSMTPVDFIWVSDDVMVDDFHVAPDLISDHAALVLEFNI